MFMTPISHKDDAIRKVIHLAERKLNQKCLVAYVCENSPNETFSFGLCFKLGNITFAFTASMLLNPQPENKHFVNDSICRLCDSLIDLRKDQ